jgi:ribosomal protein L34
MIAKIKRTFQPVAETKRQPEQAFIIRAKVGNNVIRSEFDKNRPDLIWAVG